jgi:hypothetical protein
MQEISSILNKICQYFLTPFSPESDNAWNRANKKFSHQRNTIKHRLVFSLMVFTALLGSGFQWRIFPFLWVPKLFMASAAATLNWLPADSLSTHWPPCNGSRSLLYSLGMDRTANTTSSSSSLVASTSVVAFTWWPLSHYLAMAVFTEPFLSNGCLCWLHSSDFQQTCHNIFYDMYHYFV